MHGDKLRWLAWLRVRMFVRGFRRRPGMLVASVIGVLVLLFVAGSISLAIFSIINGLTAPENSEILYLVFTGLLLFWIIMPVLSYSTNEGLDVTKLQLFPLTRAEIMFSQLFSSLFDIWTVALVLIFAAVVVVWWLNSLTLGLLSLLVVLVFYVVMVSISQLIVALLMRTLQSRRFRDLSVILIALVGSSGYIVSRLLTDSASSQSVGALFANDSFAHYLQWLPSGVAAGAIRQASLGNWGASFALLGLLVLIGLLALYLWQLVLERSMTASETGATRAARQKKAVPVLAAQAVAVAQPSLASNSLATEAASVKSHVSVAAVSASVSQSSARRSNLVDQLTALARKELLCLWRDPQLKIRLFQPIIYVAIFIILPIINKGDRASDGFYAQYTPFVSAAIVFLFLLTLAQNTLGMERQSLSTLFLFPIERKRLLWGKNLAVCLLGLVFLAALMLLCAALAREPEMILPASVIGVSGIAVALAWGNFASTYFPRYQPQVGRRGYVATGGQAQGNGGCLNQVMSLIMTIVTAITLAPVALAVGIPFFLNMSWLLGVTIPLSLLYGLAFYLILTHFSAKHMREREPEILMATTRD